MNDMCITIIMMLVAFSTPLLWHRLISIDNRVGKCEEHLERIVEIMESNTNGTEIIHVDNPETGD